jgi:hypothetical protein
MKVKRPERPIDPSEWQRQMNRRLRAEFIAGAEVEWRRVYGENSPTSALIRIVARYPGDPGTLARSRPTGCR